ncbi:MAG TPA: serine hydrolase domain-containing protein [Pontimonas sp.]|nr:serine hydrolase domain-containing protein [Pontimonas sp.]
MFTLSTASDGTRVSEPSTLISDVSGTTLHDNGKTTTPLVLGGVTKLYTLSMILREFDRGALSPDTRAAHILPDSLLRGICSIGGKDYSNDITITHLLGHQSGITDYFAHPRRGALSLLRQVADRDRSWTLEQALELAKHYPGRFRPGFGNRVHYSDTNYQILGAILKTTTGLSFEQLLNIRISGPLGLKRTSVFTPERSEKYYELAPVSYKKEVLHSPEALASFRADGAIVATPTDVLTFLRAFWSGRLFDESWVPKLWGQTRPLHPGISLGTGVMTYSRGRSQAPLVGHSGMTGAFAVVDPTRRIFAAGSLNTIGSLRRPWRVIAQTLSSLEV